MQDEWSNSASGAIYKEVMSSRKERGNQQPSWYYISSNETPNSHLLKSYPLFRTDCIWKLKHKRLCLFSIISLSESHLNSLICMLYIKGWHAFSIKKGWTVNICSVCGTWTLSQLLNTAIVGWKQPQIIYKQMGMALCQYNINYKSRGQAGFST